MQYYSAKNWRNVGDASGGPEIKTPRSHCRGRRFDPGQGSKIPHASQCDNSKKRKSCHFWRMNGPWVHYAEWNVWGRQMLFDRTFLWNLKNKQSSQETPEFIDTGNRLVVARGRRRKVAEMCERSLRYKLPVTKGISPGDVMLSIVTTYIYIYIYIHTHTYKILCCVFELESC